MKQLLIRIINALDQLIDYFHDRTNGIETRGNVELFDLLPADTTNLSHAKKYQPVRIRIALKALRKLEALIDCTLFSFIDLGSGKGRTYSLAKKMNFKDYVGIEFSTPLYNISKTNMGNDHWGSFINIDATKYVYENIPTVFFMYNPFDGVVLKKLISIFQNLNSSIYIVYVNPVLDVHLQFSKNIELLYQYTELNSNNDFNIYRLI